MNSTFHLARVRRTILLVTVLCLVLLHSTGCAWFKKSAKAEDKKVTLSRLVNEMSDLETLSRFPEPSYTNKQFSSYDPKSKTPGNEDWFANGDRGQYLRVEDMGDRKEYVMLDAEGPGAIVRIWSANPMGTLRFYFNGSPTPGFEVKMEELLGGKHPQFPGPIAGLRSAGWNIYFPFAYSRHLKLTCDKGDFYYHVNYRTYPAGTQIEDFSLDAVKSLSTEIQKTTDRMLGTIDSVSPFQPAAYESVAPGQIKQLFAKRGRKSAIDLLRIRMNTDGKERAAIESALRGVVLRIEFDGKNHVECPLGDFFGSAPGINPYAALPLGMLEDGTLYSRWVMPFRKSVAIYAVNNTNVAVQIAADARVRPLRDAWSDRTLYFNAGYHAEFEIPTRPFRDWNYVSVEGRGLYAGNALAISNPIRAWWGEGDEKIYVDGEKFPSTFGTGTEDYYGYAWCDPHPFTHPYHNQPRCDGPVNYGHTSVNRFHIIDAIPFEKDFRFDMEVWHWDKGIKVNYAAVSYWYASPEAKSNLTTPKPADLVVPPIEPFKTYKREGAIEGEDLSYGVSGGKAVKQPLGNSAAKFSGDTHMWYTNAKPGDSITFKLDAPADGNYEVIACFTQANDYGIAKVEVNGKTAIESMDFYATEVTNTGDLSLGVHPLKKTDNTIMLRVLGANPAARPRYMLGVDYFVLKPAN